MSVTIDQLGPVTVITINRPANRNAVDVATAQELDEAFENFDRDTDRRVAILTGAGGHFCAGADLKAVASGEDIRKRMSHEKPGPMGPTRRELSKPAIAAIEGFAVAGGLELACWCDLRVAAQSAVFGVFCRRWGVPLVDGGTVRLPRLIGHSRAMDMILTGRAIDAREALGFGLINRLVDDGCALATARELAEALAALPQQCLRNDRRSAIGQWALSEQEALAREARYGLLTLESGEPRAGAERFGQGAGRHGGSID